MPNTERGKRWAANNRDKVNAGHKEYIDRRKAADPAWYLEKNRRSALKKYGITLEQFTAMFDAQKGCCAICWVRFETKLGVGKTSAMDPCVDHDHKTGKVRALLCRGCNVMLGVVEDDQMLEWLTEYRDAWRKNHAPR